MNHICDRLLVSLTIPFLASCASIVAIDLPSGGCPPDAQPVELKVKFHQRFQPGTFSAVLKRRDPVRGGTPGLIRQLPDITITQFFVPAPTPGSTSSASGLSFDPHVYALRVVGDSSPTQAFDSLSDEREFQAPKLELLPPGFSPGGGYCVDHPSYLSSLATNQSVSIQLWIPRTLTQQGNLTVSLSTNNNNIALQGGAPGAPTTVTWDAHNNRMTQFTITGRNVGQFIITAEAPGYQTTTLGGQVR